MQKIAPFLWFDGQAEQAARFYVEVFSGAGRDARVVSVMPGPGGNAMGVTFELSGTLFRAFNGGPQFKFNESVSFFVDCETQDEVDYYWTKLSDGGKPDRCGWLKDRFGLSWQIVPRVLVELLQDPDPAKSQRVMQAMMQMGKIDIATLQRAREGR